ncbi:MAG: response regulator [Deltaproteobacteria bacterium]|nr:response regulator [Deltaproteobacteria bacterium]
MSTVASRPPRAARGSLERRVLVVDDHELALAALAETLRHAGYEIAEAASGEQALGVLGEREIHVLLTDQKMAGMSGTELVRAARRVAPAVVPVLVTGEATLALVSEALQLGAASVLLKPWDPEHLVHVVNRAWIEWAFGRSPRRAGRAADRGAVEVLLLTDDQPTADLVQQMLAGDDRARWKICRERSVAAAIERLGARPPDLVLLDLELAEARQSPVATLAELRARAAALPLVAITGASESDRDELLALCQAEQKIPRSRLSPERLGSRLGYALDRHRLLSAFDHLARELHASQASRLRMIEHDPDAILALALDGEVLSANPAAERLLGRRPSELVGRSLGYELSAGARAEIDLAADEHGPRTGEMHVVDTVWGGRPALLASIRDITERKRAERALCELNERLDQVDRSRSRFIAHMSHELRTPLGAMTNYVQLLEEELYGPLTAEQRKGTTGIRECAEHLLAVINDILDLSRIDAGRLPVHREPVELGPMCAELVETARALARGGPVEIRAQIEPGLPEILTDPARLRQILLNLLSNAVKFTREGVIWLRAEPEDGAERVRLSVGDTGVGIASSEIGRVFDAFYQVDSSPTREFGGAGLGLSIAKGLCELLGGTITVSSRPAAGSTFTVVLPVRPGAAEQP